MTAYLALKYLHVIGASVLLGTGARIAGFGHGDVVPVDAAQRLAHCTDPLAWRESSVPGCPDVLT